MRRRLPAGLRWRLLLALLGTSVLTLGAVALVVLPPLQDRLRQQSAESLEEAVSANVGTVERGLARLRRTRTPYAEYRFALYGAVSELLTQADARVLILDPSMRPSNPAAKSFCCLYDSNEFSPVDRRTQLAAIRGFYGPVTAIDGDTVRVARRLSVDGRLAGSLVAERELSETAALVSEVRTRFLIAAAVGLLVAAVLATGLSSTLLRRLGRLRAAALRITEDGPDAPAPTDARRDEVGDLARALARMQEELRRQETARRAFVSTASHELRTPLTMLQGTMELLEEDLRAGGLDERDALRQVGGARAGLDRLSVLAGELLDLSRLDAAVPLRSEPVELGEIARAVAAEFDLRAAERGVGVDVALPDGPCWGSGDPDAVARVVRILLDNALRYGPTGATVRVEAHTGDGEASIRVTDEGPGIPDAERDRIFERFHRGSGAGSTGGFGLGLAIGRELARRMGGELACEDAPGTAFVLRVRAVPSPAAGALPARDRIGA